LLRLKNAGAKATKCIFYNSKVQPWVGLLAPLEVCCGTMYWQPKKPIGEFVCKQRIYYKLGWTSGGVHKKMLISGIFFVYKVGPCKDVLALTKLYLMVLLGENDGKG